MNRKRQELSDHTSAAQTEDEIRQMRERHAESPTILVGLSIVESYVFLNCIIFCFGFAISLYIICSDRSYSIARHLQVLHQYSGPAWLVTLTQIVLKPVPLVNSKSAD